MSEFEKQQRAAYQKNRNHKITVRGVVILVLTLALLLCGMSARNLSQNTYITYSEDSVADYQVYLNSNEFYTEEYLDKNHAYISALIDTIEAKFGYAMLVNANKAEYNYSYYVDAKLEVLDKDSKAPLFDPVTVLVEKKTGTSSDRELNIQQAVSIDYHEYNKLSREFLNAYNLENAKSSLLVTLHVNVAGTCPDVPAGGNDYAVSLRIPLNQETLKIETNTSVPTAEAKVLACNNRSATLMIILTALLGVADLVCIYLLLRYMVQTRDRHINYARRVSKILSSYKSYVQQIKTPFNTDHYQVLHVTTFEALLEIRDTLQMPILMYENEDKTCTQFLLPTETELCYAYKISVAGVYVEV